MTELEKQIYNKHLAVSRSLKNKPFKLKTNFDDIANSDKQKYLIRISNLLKKHPEINLQTFFEAPYRLYPDVNYFGLDYFSTMRAIKSYTMYKKQLLLKDPDTQIESIKDSLRFISNFCVSEGIYFHQYPFHRTADLFTWMVHYKENKINIFSVMEFSNIFSSAKSLAEDLQILYVSDFVDKFQTLYLSYNNTKTLKPYVQKAIPILSAFVEKQLSQTKNAIL